ncbi:MAG TPA: hypothetical protein VFA69_10015 [Candidatus Nitrosotalea sp.]|jgi:hypothetical protein|nr:hypothetical protein [Candidatus Nitrosotalea sp.]
MQNSDEIWSSVKIPRTLKETAARFCGKDKLFPNMSQLVSYSVRYMIENLKKEEKEDVK